MRMETPVPLVLIATLLATALAFPKMDQNMVSAHSAGEDNVLVGQPLKINGYMADEKDDFLEVPGHDSPNSRRGPLSDVGSMQELEPSLEKALVDSENKFHVGDIQFKDDPLSQAKVVVSGRAQDFERAFKQLGYFETQEQEAEKRDEEVLEASDIETEPDSIVPEAVKPPLTISTIANDEGYVPSEPIAEGMDSADGATTDATVEAEVNGVEAAGEDVAEAQEAGAAETPTESPTEAADTSAPTAATTAAPTEAAAAAATAATTEAPTEAATAAATEAETSAAAVEESDDSKEESAAGHNHHMSIMTVAAALVAVAMVN